MPSGRAETNLGKRPLAERRSISSDSANVPVIGFCHHAPMPYLCETWSLSEAVAWAAFLDPSNLTLPYDIASVRPDGTRALEGLIAVALEAVTGLALASQLPVLGREVSTGYFGPIPTLRLRSLEFFVSEDIPGRPTGFRNIQDKLMTWTDISFPARKVVEFWPTNLKPGRG